MKFLTLRVLSRLRQIGLWLLVILTVYVTLGRLLMPLVATQKTGLEQQLSGWIGAPVSIGDIQGSWFRFGPSITVSNLRIGDPGNPALQHSIDRVEMVLDVPSSLWARQPVVSRIRAAQLSLTLQEQDDGKWALAGVPGHSGGNNDPLIDFLLNTRAFTLNEGTVVLQRKNGEQIKLGSVIFNIENRFSNHDLQLQLRINEQSAPARLVLQLKGDPRRSFSGSAWLDTEQLDLLPLIKAQLPQDWLWQQLQGHGRLWLDIDSNGIQNFSAELQDVSVMASHTDKKHQIDLQHASLKLSARPVYGDPALPADWNVRVQDAGFDWQNQTWSFSKLQLLTSHTPALRWQILASEINLAMVDQLLASAVTMQPAAQEALATLAPRGSLRNAVVETAPDGSFPKAFRLRGLLDKVAVNAWQHAPSGAGVSGYVEATAEDGFVDVDSRDFTLHLPLLFEQPWHYDKVNARVSWQASHDEVMVHSNFIDVENAELQGRVSFDVHNQRDEGGEWDNEFTLQIGMNRMQVASAPLYLPTLSNVRETMNWLRTSLKGGELDESAFVLHTITGGHALANDTFVGSWYRVHDGGLAFLPNWPQLSNVVGSVVQSNNSLDVIAESGTIAGIAVDHAEASIRPVKDTQVLGVSVVANTSTALGIDFLRNTPVHQAIGTFMDQWKAAGDIALKVGLGIDLHDHDKPPLVNVNTVTRNSTLDMTDFDLQLRKIDGEISYGSRQGLQAGKLAASLFDNPVKATIATTAPGTDKQVISIEGISKTSVAALQKWSGQPVFVRELFNYMQGDIDYKATVKVEPAPRGNEKQTRLLLESDLAGLSSSLPEPLVKTREQKSPLTLELAFAGKDHTMDFRYRDLLTGSLLLDSAGIQRGQISLGERNRTFNVRQADNNAAGLLISGDLDKLDIAAWDSVAKVMNKAGGERREVKDYLRLVDVNIGELKLKGQTLDKINVVVRHPETGWQISGRNDMLAGTLELPVDESKPWQVALNYLRFQPHPVVDKKIKNPPEEADPLKDVDPATLPAFDFKADEISVGDQNLGAFSLQFRPNPLGANISNFRLKSPESAITDTTRTIGASLDWQYMNGKHHSSFTGLFAAGDLAKVLPGWGHDPVVVSKNASFDGSLEWPGSPLHFSLQRASGTMRININDGRFVDIGPGIGRVSSALNFDAVFRRLKLDFSDIFSKGFTFDRVDGALNFTDGVVATTSPLIIDGPTANLSAQGEINLRAETIAATVKMQVPLAQNVSMLAALAAAWPLALGTYITNKISPKLLEGFTTVIYDVSGSLDQPIAVFKAPDENKNEKPAK